MKKTCKICKAKFEPIRLSTEPTCQSFECRLAFATQHLEKKREAARKEQKIKNKKEYNDKFKKLSEYEAEAKKSFQKWIRLRDYGKPCISCGKIPKDPAGGHFYNAGIYSGMIFNEDNCHLQCNAHCNKFLSGNLLEYRKGLINRYGEDFVKNLDELSNQKRNYKYTKQELIDKKQEYDLKIKQYFKN